jgi:hypothetical protein
VELYDTSWYPRVADEPFGFRGGSELYELYREYYQLRFSANRMRHRVLKRMNGFEPLIALIDGGLRASRLYTFPPSTRNPQNRFRRGKNAGKDLVVRLPAVWRNHGGSPFAQSVVEILRSRSTTKGT